MITFKIDEMVPCLKSVETGDIVETEVVRLRRKSFLSKFNPKNGWYVNWSKFDANVEIYALVLKGSVDIQGMIAITPEKDTGAVHINWAVTAPHNNIYVNKTKKYIGVGGHLLAIAGKKSLEYGFDGLIYGEAMDEEILNYYIKEFNAQEFPYGYPQHPFRFAIYENDVKYITEVYNYEDNGEEL
ncbi:MAG: hypothetical protein ACI4GD_00670 [Lachnospiraceae bacterium]